MQFDARLSVFSTLSETTVFGSAKKVATSSTWVEALATGTIAMLATAVTMRSKKSLRVMLPPEIGLQR